MTSLAQQALDTQSQLLARFVEVGRHRVLDSGSGPAVVFVPTFAELSFVYFNLSAALEKDYRTIHYLPATSARALFGPHERAVELFDVVDTLDVPSVHLVAWSDAGAVAAAFASRYPAKVASATFIGTPNRYTLPRGMRSLAGLYARTELARFTPNVLAAALIAGIMGSRAMPSRHLYRPIRDLGAVSQFLRYSILPCLQHVNEPLLDAPSLVIAGTRDRLVKASEMQTLARHLRADWNLVEAGDHFLPWTSPDQVNQTVAAFLGDLKQL